MWGTLRQTYITVPSVLLNVAVHSTTTFSIAVVPVDGLELFIRHQLSIRQQLLELLLLQLG